MDIKVKRKKNWFEAILDLVLDFLMFIVPIMEMTDLIAVIPAEYLPVYMIASVVLRRALRILQNYLREVPEEKVEVK